MDNTDKKMKILMIATLYEHYQWRRPPNTTEYSYEYKGIFRSLKEFKGGALTVVPFWFDVAMIERGKDAMNKELLEVVEKEKPDLVLSYVGGHELTKETIKKITARAKTFYWTTDDSWRFDSVSKKYAPYYSWVETNRANLIQKYKALGCHPVLMHEGVQPDLHHPIPPNEKNIDVSFSGSFNVERGKTIAALRKAGITVFVRGKGWEEGDMSFDEWIDLTQHSKITLILNPPAFSVGLKSIARLFFKRPELGPHMGRMELDVLNFFSNVREWFQKLNLQVKGRHFQTLACRTLGMTLYADGMEQFYELGKEVVIYKDMNDLIEKIRYYLAHDEEREAIAAAGYERTMRDHTMAKRLEQIFKTTGLNG